MTSDDMYARVSALEAQNDNLKKMVIAALALAVVIPVAAVWLSSSQLESSWTTRTLELDEVRAHRFVVINHERRSRGVLGADGDDVALRLGLEEGGRVALRTRPDHAALAVVSPGGSRAALWSQDGSAQARLRDAAGHESQVGVTSSGESWRAGLALRSSHESTELVADDASSRLVASRHDEQTETDHEAQLLVSTTEGSSLDLTVNEEGEDQPRRARLVTPASGRRDGPALQLDQRGAELTAGLGYIPRIRLRRGGAMVWESPVPSGMPEEPEEEEAAPEAPEPAPAARPAATAEPAAAPEPASAPAPEAQPAPEE